MSNNDSVKEEAVASLVKSRKREEEQPPSEFSQDPSAAEFIKSEQTSSDSVITDASKIKYQVILPVKKGIGDVSIRELTTTQKGGQGKGGDHAVLATPLFQTVLQKGEGWLQKHNEVSPQKRKEAANVQVLDIVQVVTKSSLDKQQLSMEDYRTEETKKETEVQKQVDEHPETIALKKYRRSVKLMAEEEKKDAISDEDDDMEDLFFDDDPNFNPENDDDEEWGLQKVPKKKKVNRGGGGVGRGRGRPRGKNSLKKEVVVRRRSTAYKDEWEQDRRLADWLAPGKSGSKAWCRACLTHLKAIKADLIAHSVSDRHKQRLKKLIDEPEECLSKEKQSSMAVGPDPNTINSKPRRSRPKKVRVDFSDEDDDDIDAEGENEKGIKRKSDSDEEYLAAYKTTDGRVPKKKNKEEEAEEEESIPIMEFEAVLAIEETMMMQLEEHKAQMAFLHRKMECEEEELKEEIKILKEQNMLIMMQKHNEQINNAKLQMDINRLQTGINTFSVVTYDAI